MKKPMIEYEKRNNINENSKSLYLFERDDFFLNLRDFGGTPYLLSFSKYSDDLSMWRAYGKDRTGLSIGFDLNMLKKYCDENVNYNTSILKCVYEHDKIISELISYWNSEYKNIKINENDKTIGFDDANLFFLIRDLCFRIKSNPYKNENEWRLCKNEFNEEKIKFHVKGNLIVPYVEHYFDKSIIKNIIIGPSSNSIQAEMALELFLKSFKYDNNKNFVERSKISYRSL